MYEIAESVADDLKAMMAAVESTPAVPVAPHVDTAITRSSIEQLVRDAEEGRRRLQRGRR